jgi:hypothetical protein
VFSLGQGIEGVRHLAGSDCVLLGHLGLTEGRGTVGACPDTYTIPVMVVYVKKGRTLFAVGSKHVHLWALTNMFQEDTWIFTATDPAVVAIGPLTWNVLSSPEITESRNISSSCIR